MKILYVVGSLNERDGGSIKVILGLAKALAEKKVELTIFAPLPNHPRDIKNYPGIHIRYFQKTGFLIFLAKHLLQRSSSESFFQNQTTNSKDAIFLLDVCKKMARFLVGYLFWMGRSRPLAEALRAEASEFDLIHIFNLWHYSYLAAYKAARRAKKPYVVTVQGELTPWALSRKNIFYRMIQKKILDKASMIQAVSKNEADNIAKFTNNKNIAVIPNGISLEDFEGPINKDWFFANYPSLRNKKIILFLGRITGGKGLEILVQAFANVLEKEPDSRLIIAGPDAWGYMPKIGRIIKKEGLLDKVIFTGMLKGKEKAIVLSCADIFVLPSESEGFSLTILEALYCRLPVIISKECNFPEVKEVGAGKIVDVDVKQLTDALLELLGNPQLCKEMGTNGKNLIMLGDYFYDNIARKMIGAYESVIKKDRGGV